MIRVTHKELLANGFEMKPESYEKKNPDDKFNSYKLKDFKKKLREGLFINITFTYAMMDNWTLINSAVVIINDNDTIRIHDSWKSIKKIIDLYKDGKFQWPETLE